MVMCSLLTDGGLRSALVIYTDGARLASFHAAPAGTGDTNRSWTLVMQVALVSSRFNGIL